MQKRFIDIAVRDLLLSIVEKPTLYLGTESYPRLNAYIGGYEDGRSGLVSSSQCIQIRESFHKWLCRNALGLDYDDTLSQHLTNPGEYRLRERLSLTPLSSILSLVCEDEQSAFRYYVSMWLDWIRDNQDDKSISIREGDTPPSDAIGIIPLLKYMNQYRTPPWDTLPQLRCYIDGYLMAYNEFGKEVPYPFPFDEFAKWLREEIIRIPMSMEYRWDRLVLFTSYNGVHAVHSFFIYVKDFCEQAGLDFS